MATPKEELPPDRFKTWDRFYQNFTLTQDPRKALRWTAREMKLEQKRLKALALEAWLEVVDSQLREFEAIMGVSRPPARSSPTSK